MKLLYLIAFAFPTLILASPISLETALNFELKPPANIQDAGTYIYDNKGKIVKKFRPTTANLTTIDPTKLSPLNSASGPSAQIHGCYFPEPSILVYNVGVEMDIACDDLVAKMGQTGGLHPDRGVAVHWRWHQERWQSRTLINLDRYEWIHPHHWVCMNELSWIHRACYDDKTKLIYTGWTQTGDNRLRTEFRVWYGIH